MGVELQECINQNNNNSSSVTELSNDRNSHDRSTNIHSIKSSSSTSTKNDKEGSDKDTIQNDNNNCKDLLLSNTKETNNHIQHYRQSNLKYSNDNDNQGDMWQREICCCNDSSKLASV